MAGTAYETPVTPGGDNPPYLVFDGLGASLELRRDWLRAVITRVLTRKYKGVCGPEYVDLVVRSVRDDPVRLREPRYQDAARTARLRVASGRSRSWSPTSTKSTMSASAAPAPGWGST